MGEAERSGICGIVLIYIYTISGAHEPPEGWQGASNSVQRHLTVSGSNTFLIWTFPQVGNRLLWSLCVRMKHAQHTACQRAPERVLLFHVHDANSRIVNITER